MNASNFAHALLAVSAQVIIMLFGMIFGASAIAGAICGGLFAVGFYFGREVAQAERKAGGSPWWVGFDVTRWSLDAVFDLVMPMLACSIVCCMAFVLF